MAASSRPFERWRPAAASIVPKSRRGKTDQLTAARLPAARLRQSGSSRPRLELPLTTDIELSPAAIRDAFAAISSMIADKIIDPSPRTRSRVSRADIDSMLLEAPPAEGQGVEALRRLIGEDFFPHVREYRHPRHYGHQRPAPLAATAIADFAAQALNPTVTMYEGGLFSVALERRVLDWMGRLAGFADRSAGSFVNGGAEGILTGLLCARERRGRGVILASGEAHYAVARAAHVLGLPSADVVEVPVGADGAIDVDALRRCAASRSQLGQAVMAVVATAGTTARGAFDDLQACGDVARHCGAWFHVDGAHGASALLVPEFRHLLRGLDLADSLTWNPHKLFWVAAPCAMFFVRRRHDLARALSPGVSTASYVLSDAPDPEASLDRDVDEPLRWTLACTRYFSAFRVYACLLVYGVNGLAARIRQMHRLACHLYGLVVEAEDFEALGPPAFNIVCFRYIGPGTSDVDAANRAIRGAIVDGDAAYITGVDAAGAYWLRAQIMSALTTCQSNRELLAIIRAESRNGAPPLFACSQPFDGVNP